MRHPLCIYLSHFLPCVTLLWGCFHTVFYAALSCYWCGTIDNVLVIPYFMMFKGCGDWTNGYSLMFFDMHQTCTLIKKIISNIQCYVLQIKYVYGHSVRSQLYTWRIHSIFCQFWKKKKSIFCQIYYQVKFLQFNLQFLVDRGKAKTSAFLWLVDLSIFKFIDLFNMSWLVFAPVIIILTKNIC